MCSDSPSRRMFSRPVVDDDDVWVSPSAAPERYSQTAVVLGHVFEMCGDYMGPDLRNRVDQFILLTYRRGLHIRLPSYYVEHAPKKCFWFWPLRQYDVLTTDFGWGCALRATQMALAEVLHTVVPLGSTKCLDRKAIVELFYDTSDAPFSLENLVLVDTELGACVKPLQFGCASSALCISCLVNTQKRVDLASVGFPDGIVRIREVERALQRRRTAVLWVTIQKELSVGENECLKHLFSTTWFKGMISGKKSRQRAYYFVGHHANNALYLDPHECCPNKLDTGSELAHMHPKKLNKLAWGALNQSKTLCFTFQVSRQLKYAKFEQGMEDLAEFLRATARPQLRALPFEMATAV
ncbi:Atg4p [Babesia ovis]|uniref:Cysteine protease n=1 Tax=Babesia ovis TaxID=5869 RepID=A0A9W5TE04_BABOV|nr:Atg4p [Babesia ovis]